MFTEDAHVTGKECHGDSIAKLRTPLALIDAALPAGKAVLPSVQSLPFYIQKEFDDFLQRGL